MYHALVPCIYVDIFPHAYGKKSSHWNSAHAQTEILGEQYIWTRCQSVLLNDIPRDFGPVNAFMS